MDIGVPKERRPFEFRVGLNPTGVQRLTQAGHRCYVEHEAGIGSGFTDDDYERAGATIVYSTAEVYGRAELVLKVQRPTQEEAEWFVEGQTIMGFLLLAAASQRHVSALLEKRITGIAYELIEDDGKLPVLKPFSQIGGRMAAQIAARFLQNDAGGKGILLAGVPGVPPADVVIIGAGTVGTNAARAFLGLGARVILMDRSLERLQEVDEIFGGTVTTMVSHDFNVARVCRFADVLVGAVQVPGRRAPIVVTREMVGSMRPRSLIIDYSIDQGGCVETSRPTMHDRPTFIEEGVIHYCVPNIPGVVARTATHAFLNAAWPYIQQAIAEGFGDAIRSGSPLGKGVVTYRGDIVNRRLASVIAKREV